jgi:tripartite-type tricarboxylate transporter receptor subunit TctC
MAAWRGMAGPQGLPADIAQTLVQTMDKIYRSSEYREFMTQRGFGMVYRAPAEYTTFMNESNENLGATMRAVGIARG